MIRPADKLRDLVAQVDFWTSVLSLLRDLPDLFLTEDEDLDTPLVESEAGVEVTVGFAVESYLISYGRLLEFAEVAKIMWPHKAKLIDAKLNRNPPSKAFMGVRDVLAQNLVKFSTVRMAGRFPGSELLAEEATADTVGDRLCMYRRLVAASRAGSSYSEESAGAAKVYIILYQGHIGAWVERLDGIHRADLAEQMRQFTASEYLFARFPFSDSFSTLSYRYLFDAANLRTEDMPELETERFFSQLEDVELPEESRDEIERVLRSIGGLISEYGYDDLPDIIGDWGGQSGKSSMTGSTKPINIIPSRGSAGQCRPLLLAMARGSSKRASGFTKVLRAVRAHLIKCQGTTRSVILLTDVWDRKLLIESLEDLRAHQRKGVAIVIGLVSGRSITPMHLP